jgi:bifunctional DNase/RNase
MYEMVIDSIRVSLMNYQRVVILKERDTDRYLPIWIGSPEADAIAVKLQDVSVPRPLTHDLMGSVISTLGAVVDHVVVYDLANDTFFAKLVLNLTEGGNKEIDCRPSDAIAIAVRGGQLVTGPDGDEREFPSAQEAQKYIDDQGDGASERNTMHLRVPIFVEDGVLEKAGILMDSDSDKLLIEEKTPRHEGRAAPTQRAVTEEEVQKMSAFSDFLRDLPGLEDLGSPSDT